MGSSNSKLNPKDIDELMRITNFNGEELNNIFHTFRKVMLLNILNHYNSKHCYKNN